MTDMMLHLDNAPKRAIRLAALAGALIFSTNVWADDDTAVTDPECEGGDVPIADSASGDPSSFAAGCGANANGDGSVAIGDKATTERFEVGDKRIVANGTLTVEGGSVAVVVEYDNTGQPIRYFHEDTNGDGELGPGDDPAESLAALVHELDPNPGDGLVPSHSLVVQGTREEFFEEVVPVKNAVAIGPNAAVHGDGGIALGRGATVGRDGSVEREVVEVVVEKRIVANGTLTVEGKSVAVVVEYDNTGQPIRYFHKDTNGDGELGPGDDPAESLAALIDELDPNPGDGLVPSHSLVVQGTREVKITEEQVTVSVVDDIPATNGIAIGNGAAVMGDNGIAIGADVEAGENQIVIGTEAHSATIAGVDIKQARTDINTNTTEIGVNRTRITNNTTEIGVNRTRITNNTARIDTNANGIAANNMAIADFNDRLLGVDERVKQVAAMSAALSAVPNTVSGDGDFFLGVGFGNSAGQQGIAVGVSARVGAKKNIIINAGAASAGDETSARVGVGFVW